MSFYDCNAACVLNLKGLVLPKMKMMLEIYSLLLYIQDIDGCSSEQIWLNSALHHLLTNGSSAVNGCHQNENDKNITIIHK